LVLAMRAAITTPFVNFASKICLDRSASPLLSREAPSHFHPHRNNDPKS